MSSSPDTIDDTIPTESNFSTESYFLSQPPPPGLEARVLEVQKFVDRWARTDKRVVVVTVSWAKQDAKETTFADEVRFLDNFSAGTRGATSAEYFLAAGYAVIFVHRQHSLRPFSRHYSHSLNPFLDLLTIPPPSEPASGVSTASGGGGGGGGGEQQTIQVSAAHTSRLLPILQAYHDAQTEGTLLQVDFTTVNDYLWLLRAVTGAMAPVGRKGMFYLAAAVSDFFLPCHRVSEHKIQSTKGNLTLEMDQVPKVLRPLVQEWIPDAYIVSFKLETDQRLLVPKARTALTRYGHQAVIGNELHKRKYEVVLVENEDMEASTRSGSTDALELSERFKETWLRLTDLEDLKKSQGKSDDEIGHLEIEELIVAELVKRHETWIAGG